MKQVFFAKFVVYLINTSKVMLLAVNCLSFFGLPDYKGIALFEPEVTHSSGRDTITAIWLIESLNTSCENRCRRTWLCQR